MLIAINKSLFEKAIINGLSEKEAIVKSKCFSVIIERQYDYLFNQNKILLPNNKEFYGYNRTNHHVLKEQKWTYVPSFPRGGGMVRSYFTPSEKNKNYKTYNPESIDDRHKLAQEILLSEFLGGNLCINYFNINIPLNNFNIIKHNDPESHLEQTRDLKDIYTNGIAYKEHRRADFLIDFDSWNEKFGRGIVFEIANTEGDKSLEEKKNDWNNIHYSYVVLKLSDFNLDDDILINKRNINVSACMDIFKEKTLFDIKQQHINNDEKIKELENTIKSLKNNLLSHELKIQQHFKDELENKIEYSISQIKNEILPSDETIESMEEKVLQEIKERAKEFGGFVLEQLEIEKHDIKCPWCGSKLKLRVNSQTHDLFIGCTFFPTCKYIMKIPQLMTLNKSGEKWLK